VPTNIYQGWNSALGVDKDGFICWDQFTTNGIILSSIADNNRAAFPFQDFTTLFRLDQV
jgi:hypothetical protein